MSEILDGSNPAGDARLLADLEAVERFDEATGPMPGTRADGEWHEPDDGNRKPVEPILVTLQREEIERLKSEMAVLKRDVQLARRALCMAQERCVDAVRYAEGKSSSLAAELASKAALGFLADADRYLRGIDQPHRIKRVGEHREIVLDQVRVSVYFTTEEVEDDDGCGDPFATGNSMTGKRGKRREVDQYIVDAAETLRSVDRAVASAWDDDGDELFTGQA